MSTAAARPKRLDRQAPEGSLKKRESKPEGAKARGRKRREGKSIQSNRLHRLLVESVMDYAIFALDPQGHVVSWNLGAERNKGYTAAEITGKHFSVFYPAKDLDAGKPQHELEVAARVGRFEDEGWRIRKDGSRFWANVVITALRNPDGELVGFAKVTRDLTERRASEEQAIRLAAESASHSATLEKNRELERLTRMLQEQAEELDQARVAAESANVAKAEFLATMSHELRTPLNAIAGHVDLLTMGIYGPVTEKQCDALDRVKHAQLHLLGIINDLLNFARVERGKLEYRLEPLILQDVVAGLAPMIEPQVAVKQLKFKVTLPAEPVSIVADQEKLVQVLLNLLSNSVKFTPPNGSITIDLDRDGDGDGDAMVGLRVIDTGIGIPTEKLQVIFDPFVQLSSGHAGRSEGTGLGLAISRELARGMGGDLSAQSAPGVSTIFTLSLPHTAGLSAPPES